ncbi:DNA polymerase III subunit alpha [bacterium]|nr:DNA polymerase III subunit alpha [bacterium]
MSFVHLHNHTDYSFLDGATKVKDLCEGAAKMEMPAVAMTDHGNLCGAIDFYTQAEKNNIKPIIGCELYLTAGKRTDRGKNLYGKEQTIYHLVVLAKNHTGWKNLIKLSSAGYLEGFYKKPRIDYDILESHSEGLICLSGCIQSHISQTLLTGGEDEAYKLLEYHKDMFGEDFYLELQNHGLPEEEQVAKFLVENAPRLGSKLVMTNDSHYLSKKHAVPHDLLLCVQTRSDYHDPNRWRFTGEEFYLKDRQEMLRLFPEIPEALDNTLEIAEKVDLKFDFKQKHFPTFPLPDGYKNDEDYLWDLCRQGLPKRYSEVTEVVEQRLRDEMTVIVNKKLSSYFLIVRDFIDYARSKNIPVGPGRGSAAGSLVSYLVGITNIDPLRYDLLFERFINPERESYPDIDVDFSDTRRSEVIEYVRRTYGDDSVSQIITFGRMLSKGVVRDVGRVMGIPLHEVDAIAKKIPDGPKVTLESALKETKDLRELVESRDQYKDLIEQALLLEGTIRNAGIHAAGVVITPQPIQELVPLYKAAEGDPCTQFDMGNVEKMGLLKVDFLGLKTLTILERTLNLIKRRHGEVDLEKIPLDDPKTYELFSNGETIGIFQFESGGMRENLIKLKPERLEDLIAMNALYRPGPMEFIDDFINRKHGRQRITYLHQKLAEILDETYGVIVYQEQVMKIANLVAGMSLGRADVLRRAMGKKKEKLMAELMPEFVEGCAKREINEKTAKAIWELIERFAKYGFNKSHAAGYALVAYQTGYLKARYPSEFMAASMTTRQSNTDELVLFLDECRRMNVKVLPPDVNESEEDFTVTDDGSVRFGLVAIKNVGGSAIQAILGARDVYGKFRDLFDLVAQVDSPLVNRRVLENLINAGATDSLEGHRGQHLHVLDQALQYAHQLRQEKSNGQVSIFGEESGTVSLPRPTLPNVEDIPSHQRLANEKNLVGVYFSGHPLLKYKKEIRALSTSTVADLDRCEAESNLTIAGLLTHVEKRPTRKGPPMGRGKFEDLTGPVNFIVFPKTYERLKEDLQTENPVLIHARLQKRENGNELIVEEVYTLTNAIEKMIRGLDIVIHEDVSGKSVLAIEKEIQAYPGDASVRFVFSSNDNGSYTLKCKRYKIAPDPELFSRLEVILGKDALKLHVTN